MNRYALIFPGIGYHTDKPLLYYGKKLAAAHGYEVVEISYTGFEKGIRGNEKKMREAFLLAMSQTEAILAPRRDGLMDPCAQVLMIGKSIGTVVGAAWAAAHDVEIRALYYTPVAATFSCAKAGSGIVFHGNADPWVQTSLVEQECERLGLPLYVTPGANHSLETGHVDQDLAALREVMRRSDAYLTQTDAAD